MTEPCRASIDERHHDESEMDRLTRYEAAQQEAETAIGNVDEVEEVILALKNMSATERHKLHSAFLSACTTEHFDLINISINAMMAKRMGTI